MKYYVSIAAECRLDVCVEAASFEEAKKKAEAEVCESDFGEVTEVIGWHAVNAEREDGMFRDY